MKNYKLEEVFTPSQPAFHTYVERNSVNNQIQRAIRTPGKQLIIYGHSGAGKTTILANIRKSLNLAMITTRCIKGMTLSNILLDAFNNLDLYYRSTVETGGSEKSAAGIGASYFGIKASLNLESSDSTRHTMKRAVDIPITPQTLAKYMGEANRCWVIEDFHKIDEKEKVQMAQIMKVFMDLAVEYPHLRIIAIGAVNTAREVVQYDPEMKNRVSEIHVPLMSESELKKIINQGSKLLNVQFEQDSIDKIATYSSGLASVTHQLSLLMCELEGIQESNKVRRHIKATTLDLAIDEYIREYSDTLKSIYDTAIRTKTMRKYENPRDILNAILTYTKESVSQHEVANAIRKLHPEYKSSNLRKYLDELTTTDRGEILRYDKDSYTYHFSNPFLRAYAQFMRKAHSSNAPINRAKLLRDLTTILRRELETARQAFKEDFADESFSDESF